MPHFGVSFEGLPSFPLKQLDNGYVVPDASISDLKQRHETELRNQVTAAVEAEQLGYEYVVTSEHHANLLSTVSPNPILTHTAIARETDDVRLLQMANILPWHEPVRLAEQLSMLDILSDGRIDVGVGRGFGFAAETMGQYWGGTTNNQTKNQQSFEEKYEILLSAWTEDLSSYHGQFHQVPPKYTEWDNNQEYYYFADDVSEYKPDDYMTIYGDATTLKSIPILPKPAQEPHPQLWKPALSPKSGRWSARNAMNVGTHIFELSETKQLVDAYYDAAENAGWPDHRPEYDGKPFRRGWDEHRRRGIGLILSMFNTEIADDETIDRWRLGIAYSRSRKRGREDPASAQQISIDVDEVIEENPIPIVGDAEEIIDQIDTIIRTCEFESFLLVTNVESTGLTHEERMQQLRSIVEDIRPYFEETIPTSA